MDRDEVRMFKSYATGKESEDHRKDLGLFDLYRKSAGDADDKEFSGKLKYGENMNAYYRLKNRLLEDVNKVLVMRQLEKDDYIQTLHLVSLYRYHYRKMNFRLAHYYLKRAEKSAVDNEHYDVLDTIYGEMIRLSQEIITIDPEVYIGLRKVNLDKLNKVRQIDEIIAVLNHRLKITQNIGRGGEPIIDIYDSIIMEYTNDQSLSLSPQSKIRLYKVVSRLMVQKKDFEGLEALLVKTFADFEKERIFNKNTHELKIEMLVYLVNTLNALQKYPVALAYCQRMKSALEEFGGILYGKYSYFYYQGLVAAYANIQPERAVDTLNEMLTRRDFQVDTFYDIFIYSNLAICYSALHNYQMVIRSLNRVYINDMYLQTDQSLRMKLVVFEMIARYEQEDMETLVSRVERMEKEFLSPGSYIFEFRFLDLLLRMAVTETVWKDKALKADVVGFLEEYDALKDEFRFPLQWLKEKFRLQN